MADRMKRGFDWLLFVAGVAAAFLFSMARLSPPSWAQGQRGAAPAGAANTGAANAARGETPKGGVLAPGIPGRPRVPLGPGVPGADVPRGAGDQIGNESLAPEMPDADTLRALDEELEMREAVAPKVTSRDALRAMDDQIEILIDRLSRSGEFDQRTQEELRDLGSIIDEYLVDPQMDAKITHMPVPNLE